MLAYYKRLIQIRKSYSCLVEDDAPMQADDATGLVTIRRGELVLLFHGKEGVVTLPEYAGKINLLTNYDFDGTLDAYEAAVLMM